MSDGMKVRINWAAIGVVVGLVIGTLTWALSTSERVAKLETKSDAQHDQLDRIETKLERVVEIVTKDKK